MVTVEKQGAVTVVRPVGPLTVAQAEDFRKSALGKLGQGRPMVVVDMHEAPLLDSAGLEALVELRDRVEARGGAIKLAAVNALCGDILRLTGVGYKFEQYGLVKTRRGKFCGMNTVAEPIADRPGVGHELAPLDADMADALVQSPLRAARWGSGWSGPTCSTRRSWKPR